MQTTLECLVCFVRQARAAGLLATDDPVAQRRLVDEAGRFLQTADNRCSPPENAAILYQSFARLLDNEDPFAAVKAESNSFALALQEEMADRIAAAEDPLYAAIRVAIGGNIIDYAAQHVFDAEKTMASCLDREFVIDDYEPLRQRLEGQGVKNILYLCDNCGEIVFDGLLVKELQRYGCRVTAAVREQPIINDATMEDALTSGLDRICKVITNGTGCPGTPLDDCSETFRQCFAAADIVVSKGMGNYETLSEAEAPIFFLFTVKCSEVARHVTRRKQLAPGMLQGRGEMVLMAQLGEGQGTVSRLSSTKRV